MVAVLSVIIPTYNIERYLRQCLDSVVNQTYKNLEIIIIDDNSTDSTPEIIREYAARDGRIKAIFHATNQGPGNTRNEGLSLAIGDYVTLMDHDDWQDLTKYEKMMTKLEATAADFVVCDAEEYNQTKGKAFTKPWYKHLRPCAACQPISIATWEEKAAIINGYTAPWAKIMRREMIEAHKIRFSGGANKSDDVLFHYHLCMVAKTVAYVPEVLYTHRFFQDSISGQWREGGDAMFKDRLHTWQDIEKLCTKYAINPKEPLRFFIKKLAIYAYRAENSKAFAAEACQLLRRLDLKAADLPKKYRKYRQNLCHYSPSRRFWVRLARFLKIQARLVFFGRR